MWVSCRSEGGTRTYRRRRAARDGPCLFALSAAPQGFDRDGFGQRVDSFRLAERTRRWPLDHLVEARFKHRCVPQLNVPAPDHVRPSRAPGRILTAPVRRDCSVMHTRFRRGQAARDPCHVGCATRHIHPSPAMRSRLGGNWRCTRCRQRWDARRLAAMAPYAAWVAQDPVARMRAAAVPGPLPT